MKRNFTRTKTLFWGKSWRFINMLRNIFKHHKISVQSESSESVYLGMWVCKCASVCVSVCVGGGQSGVEGLQSKVELLLCTCCEPLWIRGPAKHLKCKWAGSCWGASERGREEGTGGVEVRGGQRGWGGGGEARASAPWKGEEEQGGELRVCAAGGRRQEFNSSEDVWPGQLKRDRDFEGKENLFFSVLKCSWSSGVTRTVSKMP